MTIRLARAGARLGAAALTVACSLAAAVPAFAADTQADLAVSIAATTVAVGGDKLIDVRVGNNGPDAAGLTLTIDLSGLDTSKVTPDPAGADWASSVDGEPLGVCTAAGSTLTCSRGDLPAGGHDAVEFTLTGVAAGAAGQIRASVAATNATDAVSGNDSVARDLTVTSDTGVDVVAVAWDVYENIGTRFPVMVGTSARLIFGLANSGTVAAEGVRFTLNLPPRTTFSAVPSICRLNSDKTVATCADPGAVLPAGQGFLVAGDAFRVRVGADAPAPAALKGGVVEAHALGEAPATAAAPTGHVAGFSTASGSQLSQREIDAADNVDMFAVFTTPAQPLDISANLLPADVAVGDQVEISGVIHNGGAAPAPQVSFTVVAPGGTRIVGQVPPNCDEAVPGRKWLCQAGDLPFGGEEADFPMSVTLKILSSHIGTDGYLKAVSEAPDPNLANNTAPFDLTVTGAGGSGGSGGGLPVTGARAGLIGGAGGAALLAGAGVLVLARRRRVVMVTEAGADARD